MKWTAAAVKDALRTAYGVDGPLGQEEWAWFEEVPLRTRPPGWNDVQGYAESRWSMNERSIDVFLVRNWSGGKKGHQRIGIEVKVSRADYRQETDEKRAPTEAACHLTYYAAPAGLIDPDTLPDGWGLIEVYEDHASFVAGSGREHGPGWVRCRTKATPRTPECGMDYLVSAVARKGSRALERLRRGEDDAALVSTLRADVERLMGQLQRRDEAVQREKERARVLNAELMALVPGQVCAACEEPVKFIRNYGSRWEHVDPVTEERCHRQRAEANRLERERSTGAAYLSGYPGPVEPKAAAEAREVDARRDASAESA